MEIRPLTIGSGTLRVTLPDNIFLAPMAGYTDYAFRSLCIKAGAGLVFTELVSAKGLCYGGKGSKELLYCGNEGDINHTAAQIFGAEPYYMRAAAESDDLKDFKIVDVNMGCPVPKVYKNGEGSALLGDVNAAEKIVKECVKSGKIITVKIRTGLKYGDDVAAEYAKMAENAGASLVTVHGRVREAYYSGEPDFAAIERAVRAVKIPVIANGGIFTVADAEEMAAKTGAAGVMLARGALCNPFLFSRLLSQKPFAALKEFIAEQLRLSALQKGELRAVKEFRKFAPYYFKGVKDAKEVKKAISVAERAEEVLSALN